MRYPCAQNGHALACKMAVLSGWTHFAPRKAVLLAGAGRICCAASDADGRTDAREKLKSLPLQGQT